jgi:hypothetical protein
MVSHQNNVFIDPENCGSSIGYYINVSEYTDKKTNKTRYSMAATVVLNDCSHRIDWSFFDDSCLDKIDAAISMLQEFRKKYTETTKLITKLNK